MEITKTQTITVSLSPEEITEILKEYFKNRNIEIDSVRYRIGEKHDEGDWRGEYPPTPFLQSIECTAQTKENGKERLYSDL
jgi:hypothetical protein